MKLLNLERSLQTSIALIVIVALALPAQLIAEPTEIFVNGLPFQDSVDDVSQSVSVLDEEELEKTEAQSLQDTLEQIPGLSYVGGTSRPRFLMVRGIGEREQYEGAPNPSVATIIDGIDFSGLGLPLPLYDISRVELLRGPQGIRFGANGLAGALNVRSADPTVDTSGNAILSGGNDDFFSTGAAISGAIPGTDNKLLLRLSAYHLEQDGFRDNVFLNRDDTNGRDESFARMKLLYEDSQDFSAELVGWVSDANNGYDAFAIDNSLTTQSDKPGEDDLQSYAGSLTLKKSLSSNVVLESITAGLKASQDYSFDGDWGNDPFWAPYDPYDYFSDSDRVRKMFSQELRVLSDDTEYQHGEDSRWLVGAFAQDLREDTTTREFAEDFQYDFLDSDYRAKTGALFAQYEQPLQSALSLTLGARAERRVVDYTDSTGADFAPNFNMYGGQASLAYDVNENLRSYVSVSRGFKGGGFNAGPSVPTSSRLYDPEFLWNYEVGLKGNLLEDKVHFNLALFHQHREDQQLSYSIQDDPDDPLSFTYITASVAEGRSTGVELSANAEVLEGVTFFLNGSLIDTEYTEFPTENSNLDGRSFAHAPNWQYFTGADVSLCDNLSFRTSLSGRDRFFFGDSHNNRSQPYYLLNAALAYETESLRVSIWGRNLTDESYAIRGFFFGNEPPNYEETLYIQRGGPRSFGVTFRYFFS